MADEPGVPLDLVRVDLAVRLFECWRTSGVAIGEFLDAQPSADRETRSWVQELVSTVRRRIRSAEEISDARAIAYEAAADPWQAAVGKLANPSIWTRILKIAAIIVPTAVMLILVLGQLVGNRIQFKSLLDVLMRLIVLPVIISASTFMVFLRIAFYSATLDESFGRWLLADAATISPRRLTARRTVRVFVALGLTAILIGVIVRLFPLAVDYTGKGAFLVALLILVGVPCSILFGGSILKSVTRRLYLAGGPTLLPRLDADCCRNAEEAFALAKRDDFSSASVRFEAASYLAGVLLTIAAYSDEDADRWRSMKATIDEAAAHIRQLLGVTSGSSLADDDEVDIALINRNLRMLDLAQRRGPTFRFAAAIWRRAEWGHH